MRISETLEIARPAELVFRFLSDFSTVVQWDHSVVTAVKLTAGAAAVGSKFDVQLKLAGKVLPCLYRITTLEKPNLICLEGRLGEQKLFDRIEITPLGNTRCRIDYQLDVTATEDGQAPPSLLKPVIQHYGAQTMKTLKLALEPEALAASTRWRESLADRLLLPGAYKFTRKGYEAMPNRGLSETMDGKTVVLTGPTSGIGLAAACELSRLGARLVLVGRASPRLDDAVQTILDFSGAKTDSIVIYPADLQLLESTSAVAEKILANESRIDCLINNAGALFNERAETSEGHEQSLALLLLSPWHLGNLLLPRLLENKQSRIINVASGGMYLQGLKLSDMEFEQAPYDGPKAYARAKRGLIAVSEHWAEKHAAEGLISHSMHPGWVATAGVEKALPEFNKKMAGRLRNPQQGADTVIWLASSTAAASRNGEFWLDRRPHPTSVIPGTEASHEKKKRLIAYLHKTTTQKATQKAESTQI